MCQPFCCTLYDFRGDITAIKPTEEAASTYKEDFELYVLREDVTVNPIAERADSMREQAAEEGGLCVIKIPAYNDADTTESYLGSVVSSVSGSAQCTVNVCRSVGCHGCTGEGGNTTCVPCATSTSSDCDGLANVVEYRYCDCDAVVTVNENNEFSVFTGKVNPYDVNCAFMVHLLMFFFN